MSVAAAALYLCALTINVGYSFHCPEYFVIKARPPTMRLKLMLRAIKLGSTASTNIGPLLPKCIVSARKRHLCALPYNNMLFFR
jgi:hypothetical protein